jgi:hypothetical protein
MMKTVGRTLVWVCLLSVALSAASIRNQILLMEASETIRLESQKIVKNYLYYYLNPKKRHYKALVYKGLEDLDKQFRLIAKSTKDADSKDVLAFLDYSKEKMQEVLDNPLDKDNPALMLDYSEILLEGAESISKSIDYTPSEEEKMLMHTKDISFLIERMTKFYMAIIEGGDVVNYAEMLGDSIEKMDKDLALLDAYPYGSENLQTLRTLKTNWGVLKRFYLDYKTLKIPSIVLLSSLEVERNAHALELYHSKNQ